jgi:putative endonuclease
MPEIINIEKRSGMALHIELGKEGEEMAVKWLRERDYTILHCNWRYSYYELDIIAIKTHTSGRQGPREFLHFIEVKSRKAGSLGLPEDSVTKKKFKNLQRAADQYLLLHPGHQWIQFDILAITIGGKGGTEYFLIEDLSF